MSRYSERLYWHIRHFSIPHDDADDILQDVFLKVWKALPAFRGDSLIYTWLYRIATNEVINWIRKKKLMSIISLDDKDAGVDRRIDDDPWFNGDKAERDLLKCINKLPTKQRQVFIFRYYDELPYEQISEITGISVNSLKVSYHFAYNKIKEEMLEKDIKEF